MLHIQAGAQGQSFQYKPPGRVLFLSFFHTSVFMKSINLSDNIEQSDTEEYSVKHIYGTSTVYITTWKLTLHLIHVVVPLT